MMSAPFHLFLFWVLVFHPNFIYSKLIYMSVDGFRWDYIHKYGSQLPTLSNLVKQSTVIKDGLVNVFPTVTFPNHWSMMTGQWPEEHGIISNQFYDRQLDDSFNMLRMDAKFWNQSRAPIWVEAERNNITTVVIHFPGCGVTGFEATYSYPENVYHTPYHRFASIVDKAYKAFNNKSEPAEMAVIYIGEPDNSAHIFGPDSDIVIQQLQEIDDGLKYLLTKLKAEDNLIITADHGMTFINETKSMPDFLSYFPANIAKKVLVDGPLMLVYAMEGQEEAVESQADQICQKHPEMTYYTKDSSPKWWHIFGNELRSPNVLLVLPYGWHYETANQHKGMHGWDNKIAEMRPIFIGHGKNFRHNYTHNNAVFTVDMYPLLAHLAGLKLDKNSSGQAWNFSRISQLTVDNSMSKLAELMLRYPAYVYPICGVLIGIVLICICYAVIVALRYKKEESADDKGGYFLVDLDRPNDLEMGDSPSVSVHKKASHKNFKKTLHEEESQCSKA